MEPQKRNIFSSITLITTISSIMGVFPTNTIFVNGFRVGKPNNIFRYWVTLIHTSIYTFCLIAANVGEDIFTSKKQYNFNKIAYLLYIGTVLTEILSTYVIYALTLYATPLVIHVIEGVRRSDAIMAKIGHKFKYRTGFFINFVVITTGMYFIVFNISLEVWNSPRENMGSYSFFEIVVICWPQFLIHMAESQFIQSSMLLFTRFFVVNVTLESLYKTNGGKDFLQEPTSFLRRFYNFVKKPELTDEHVLYTAMKSQYILYRISVVQNNVYGLIMTLSALIQFTTIAFAVCFCYYKLETKPIATIVWLLWAILRLYELIRKAFMVQLVRGEANKSIYYVNKLMMLNWNEKITNRLSIFAMQLSHCKVKYTACGLFDIDGTLVFTIIAAATMYIIVTYQFQQGLINKCDNETIATGTLTP